MATNASPAKGRPGGRSAGRRRPPASAQAPAGPDPELLRDAAETFAMLASPTRLHLLWLLARGEYDVGTLARAVHGSDAMVSQHLAKLRLTDLVSSRREGKRQIYVVDDDHVVALLEQALDHHAQRRG